jgi:hypothetical protein
LRDDRDGLRGYFSFRSRSRGRPLDRDIRGRWDGPADR